MGSGVISGFRTILFTARRPGSPDGQSGRNILLPSLSTGIAPASNRKPSYHSPGYTLIELVVVLVLLGLIFGITVPKFRQNLFSNSLDAASLRLIGLVQELRERAVSSQMSQVLHFDIRNNRIWFFAKDATEEEQDAARARAFELSEDVRIENVWSQRSGTFYDEGEIFFSRKGYVEQSVIHLQSEDGREITLELTPFLGSVKIHEGYVDIARG